MDVFETGPRRADESEEVIKELHGQIGEATMEQDFLSLSPRTLRPVTRRALITSEEQLPITRQCEPLGVARSSVYYQPVPVWAEELAIKGFLYLVAIMDWHSRKVLSRRVPAHDGFTSSASRR